MTPKEVPDVEKNQGEPMKHLLNSAMHEIRDLRRSNEILSAKVEVVNIFAAALLGPRPQQGMAVDVMWQLQKAIDELNTPQPIPPAS